MSRLFFVPMALLMLSCNRSQNKAAEPIAPSPALIAATAIKLDSLQGLIRSGDIVFRTGADFTSSSLQKLCRRDRTFSHCGIAERSGDSVFIYHALGGEFNPDQRIKREYAGSFFQPSESYRAGIYRFSSQQLNKEKLLLIAAHLFKARIPFDLDFDLRTDERMYCAEFVAKSLQAGFVKDERIHVSRIDTIRFIGPDDIFLHPGAQRVAFLDYRIY